MRSRLEHARQIVAALFADEDALLDAVAADGWPREMARVGFDLHRRTWDVDAIAETVTRERQGGADSVVTTAAHLWPALPGAGVTPLLYGYLAGVETQLVRPGRRSSGFGQFFLETWRAFDDHVEAADGAGWREVDRVIVSGSDETVATLVDELGPDRVSGYGHRVSFALVDDRAPSRWASRLATDVVLWHQTGCFSCRGVVVVGDEAMARQFAEEFADAIAAAEERLGATFDEGQLAGRMQARGAAEFETDVFAARYGWVELRDALRDRATPPHVVAVAHVADPSEIAGAVQIAREHVQGVAVAAPREGRAALIDAADALGATRVARPGDLQRPPAAWPHDGAANLAAFSGTGAGRVTRSRMWIDADLFDERAEDAGAPFTG